MIISILLLLVSGFFVIFGGTDWFNSALSSLLDPIFSFVPELPEDALYYIKLGHDWIKYLYGSNLLISCLRIWLIGFFTVLIMRIVRTIISLAGSAAGASGGGGS